MIVQSLTVDVGFQLQCSRYWQHGASPEIREHRAAAEVFAAAAEGRNPILLCDDGAEHCFLKPYSNSNHHHRQAAHTEIFTLFCPLTVSLDACFVMHILRRR